MSSVFKFGITLFFPAGKLNFTNDDVQSFRSALYRPGNSSPTDEMLTVWDYSCHTITELYHKLYEMRHARSMMLLKDLGKSKLTDGEYSACAAKYVAY